MDEDELKSLVLTAISVGMNFKRNQLNKTYLTDDMTGEYREMHGISIEDWKKTVKEFIDIGLVDIADDGGYVITGNPRV